MKKGNLAASRCPGRTIVDETTGLWGYLILRSLRQREVVRFAEFKEDIQGVSEKMLSQTLKRLERSGFITRKSYPVVPPKVEYRLTSLGKGYSDLASKLCDYVEDNVWKIVATQNRYDEQDNSRPWQKAKR